MKQEIKCMRFVDFHIILYTVVTEFEISELWKRMSGTDFFKFLKKCYFSKKKAQLFCDVENKV